LRGGEAQRRSAGVYLGRAAPGLVAGIGHVHTQVNRGVFGRFSLIQKIINS
jgi:hypothetical protein